MRSMILAGTAVLLAGCVERSISVVTNVPAVVAMDHVDNVMGATLPLSTGDHVVVIPFHHYGTRRIIATADGFSPAVTFITLKPPWWEMIPFDFFAEVLVPVDLRDEREVNLTLSRTKVMDPDALLDQALRDRAASVREIEFENRQKPFSGKRP